MMRRGTFLPRLGWFPVVALTALAFGFFFATQLRSQLIPPSAQVARNQALVGTVQRLERDNAASRGRIADLRRQVAALERQAAARSDSSMQLANTVADLRAHAGLTRIHGPGETVSLRNGKPGPTGDGNTAYLVNYEDIQDVVNLLFQAGAEGVSVNGRRVSPLTGFRGSGGAILIDQGSPLLSPYRVSAVGNRAQMEQQLADPARLGDLRSRVTRYGLQLSLAGAAELTLPAYDSSLQVTHAIPQQ